MTGIRVHCRPRWRGWALERLVEITAAAPARFFGIERRKGRLARGFDADFAVLDKDETWTVRGENLHNMNRYTPHEGQTFTGVFPLAGSVTPDGSIDGTLDGTFGATQSTGGFTGQVSGKTLSSDFVSQSTAGETCRTAGTVSATR